MFGYLESLFLCDLIDEVRVTVERMDGTRVKFAQLSEGEQQLLTVLGLLLFTQNDESLYLLDEPDTHLNPVWTYDFLSCSRRTSAPRRATDCGDPQPADDRKPPQEPGPRPYH